MTIIRLIHDSENNDIRDVSEKKFLEKGKILVFENTSGTNMSKIWTRLLQEFLTMKRK